MTNRKRGHARRRKNEAIMHKKDESFQMSDEMEIAIGFVILTTSFLEGVFIGYLIRKFTEGRKGL